MSKDRYEKVATLLGGKRKGGAMRGGVRVVGSLPSAEYSLAWVHKQETEFERYGLLGRKQRRRRTYVPVHVFHLRSQWHDEPGTAGPRSGGGVTMTPATPRREITLSDEQEAVLADAMQTWPGIEVTNLGLEWVLVDEEHTAQELAVTIQGLAGLLQSLHPERDGSRAGSLVRAPLEALRRLRDSDQDDDAEIGPDRSTDEPLSAAETP